MLIPVTQEYIRVTYEYIDKFDNIQVIYECTGYILLHSSSTRWQEDNNIVYRKRVFFLYVSFLYVRGSNLADTQARGSPTHAYVLRKHREPSHPFRI